MLAIIPWALFSQNFLSFCFFLFFAFFSFIYQNFRYVAVFRTVEIAKERSCDIPSLNKLIYNKIIKQTAKPAAHVQNMSGLDMLQFEVKYVLSRIQGV